MTEEFTDSLGIGNTFNLSRTIAEYPLIELDERSCRAIESYLTMCRDLAHETGNPHREEILRLTTRAFFLGLGHTIHKQHTAPKERGAELTTKFLRLVEAHYRTHRNLSFYAEQMSLTPKYLSTAVKATSGKSAMQWIEYYVILDASSQLSSTERTIKEIAYDLNFPSQSFFGKYFSRIVGLSPLAYRRKRLQTE